MTTPTLDELRTRFAAAGQEHVFRFVDELDDASRDAFAAQLGAVDLDWVRVRHKQVLAEKGGAAEAVELAPAPVIALPKNDAELSDEAAARAVGEEALRQGRLCAFLVAGGQGTRLGFDGPKGAYPLGPVTERTLFQIHAEQILARATRFETVIPWYIMTSAANDAATRACFAEHDYFGFDAADVMFFQQEMVPAVDFEGRLLLADKSSLALSPNGHGGSLFALVRSGATADMKRRGIDTISYFQVDNPLVTICDPVFAGHHISAGAEMSSKALRKNCPEEKVGAFGLVGDTLTVIEYSDLDEKQMYATGDDGEPVFWAGSIAIHMLDVAFVDRIGGGELALPWHVAHKKVPCVDADGAAVKPTEPNGVKFETFVFDALPFTTKSVTLEVAREEEFAPVKNPSGADSAESSRQLLTDYAARMLRDAGADMALDVDGHFAGMIELSSRYALDADELRGKITDGLDVRDGLVLS